MPVRDQCVRPALQECALKQSREVGLLVVIGERTFAEDELDTAGEESSTELVVFPAGEILAEAADRTEEVSRDLEVPRVQVAIREPVVGSPQRENVVVPPSAELGMEDGPHLEDGLRATEHDCPRVPVERVQVLLE